MATKITNATPKNLPEAVVVVDPFGAGGIPFIEDLRGSDAFIICILSSNLLGRSWMKQWNTPLYDASLEHVNMEDTLSFIKGLPVEVKAIFPGSEPGVSLAEDLREHFDNVGKNVGPSAMRRHKHTMHKALRAAGVRGIVECLTGDVEEALQWVKDTTKYPVIVKPPMSGGSDGLYFCHSDDDVREAYSMEANKVNVNGELNTQLLVQEFLDGPEYVVDAISYEGKHLIVGIWRYYKLRNEKTKAITYEYSEFLPFDGPEQEKLRAYVLPALDALGVRFGASHSEVIIDSTGPCLVESGARLHGALGTQATPIATGMCMISVLTDIALHNARLWNDLYKTNRYILKQYLLSIDLANFEKEGILTKCLEGEIRKSLTTIKGKMSVRKPGERIEITRDMASSPGEILIAHPSMKVLMEEYAILRRLEASNLYEVRSEVDASVGVSGDSEELASDSATNSEDQADETPMFCNMHTQEIGGRKSSFNMSVASASQRESFAVDTASPPF